MMNQQFSFGLVVFAVAPTQTQSLTRSARGRCVVELVARTVGMTTAPAPLFAPYIVACELGYMADVTAQLTEPKGELGAS